MSSTAAILAPDDLRQRLRAGTAADHERLENHLDLLREPLAEARFRAVLERFHGFHFAWEPAAARWLPAGLLAPRQRVPLLRADLRALGRAEAGIDALPVCAEAAALCSDLAGTLGSFYVLEGSTLGGRLISRALAAAAWLPAGGLRYFDPHGAATGERWRETLAHLNAAPATLHADVVQGARRCFACLDAWLAPATGASQRTTG